MAETETQICNLALSHLGTGNTISNLESERSEEAIACRVFYDLALESTLRDSPWTFATGFSTLSEIEEDPTSEWDYSYRLPSDCIYVRRILSGTRSDTQASRIAYRLLTDDEGGIMYTDQDDVEIEYTRRIENVALFPADFVLALSYRLASMIAQRLTGGDSAKVGEKSFKMYQLEISKADAASYNEEQFERVPESEFVRARE